MHEDSKPLGILIHTLPIGLDLPSNLDKHSIIFSSDIL